MTENKVAETNDYVENKDGETNDYVENKDGETNHCDKGKLILLLFLKIYIFRSINLRHWWNYRKND